jgi:thiol-disulfide isomerase/thioredoxin
MVESSKASSTATTAMPQRKLFNICVASIASLSSSHHSVTAFSPLVSTTTSSSSFAKTGKGTHQLRHTAAFLSTTPKRRSSLCVRGNLYVNNSHISSLVLRSAVIQSYRVEDDPNVSHQKVDSLDALSFLPSRLSTIERLENPSRFKSVVMDEQDSLIVVRFSADSCPSCKATGPLFRRWSRDVQTMATANSVTASQDTKMHIKIVEMPLNKATSSFMQDKLHVESLPYCHLYHPKLGLVEEQLVMNKVDFNDFVGVVDKWAAGLVTPDYDSCILCSKDELIEDCQEFC